MIRARTPRSRRQRHRARAPQAGDIGPADAARNRQRVRRRALHQRPRRPQRGGLGCHRPGRQHVHDHLQQAYLQIHSASDCDELIPGFDDATQSCAGTTDRAGACFGDSGGPLVKRDADMHEPVLWGVTSSRPEFDDGTASCSPSVPAQFTWIPAFADFIHNTLAATPSPTPRAQLSPIHR